MHGLGGFRVNGTNNAQLVLILYLYMPRGIEEELSLGGDATPRRWWIFARGLAFEASIKK